MWKANIKKFDHLSSNISCDTAIIGGGVAGLWCAYHLIRAGQKVVVLESKRIGSGVTSGSTSILTYAQDIIYKPLIKKHGVQVAKQYLSDTKNAITEIAEIVKTNSIECEFESINFVLFSTKRKGARALRKEKKALAKIDQWIEETEPELPYRAKRALKFEGAYQFNPLKLCAWLADYIVKNGGQIFENTHVINAPDKNKLKINNYTVTAKNFIVATHFPIYNLPGFYWLKMYQHQNYAIAFKPSTKFKDFCKGVSYESIDETGFEYRLVGENILIDGVPVRTGDKQYKSKYRIIEKHLIKHFGKYKEESRFMAQDCITMDKLPYAGRYSHFSDNVWVVTGFNKWGMTNSFVTAKTVTDMILNGEYENNIYSPQRVALFVNLIETVDNVATIAASFANNLLNLDTKKFNRIDNNQGAIIKYKGKRLGASRDEKGKLSLISGLCPHMGCNLKWNKDERTFDCPCHGSRFDPEGNIINNPSTKNCQRVK